MHAVELLEQALAFARQSGYHLRQEWLGGSPGGVCEFGGKRWLFVDLSLDPHERLAHVLKALHAESQCRALDVPAELQWTERRAA